MVADWYKLAESELITLESREWRVNIITVNDIVNVETAGSSTGQHQYWHVLVLREG